LTEHLQTIFELTSDVAFGFADRDSKRAAHDFQKGQKRRLLAIRGAASGEDKMAFVGMPLPEFMEQPGFTYARLARNVDYS
jgi:hypothetical protein